MRPPCEIISQTLLPLIRGYIAYDLTQQLTQQEVAERMGVSQPTISSYLKSYVNIREAGDEEYFENESIKNLVKIISEMIQSNKGGEEIIREICSTCITLRVGGLTCRKHFESYPNISPGCTACLPVIDHNLADMRKNILSQINEAVSIVENEPNFVKISPQVMVNICQCIPFPQTIDDVAAIPGRLTKVRDRLRAMLPSEFGVSSHLAKFLINLNKLNEKIQSIICIKYDTQIHSLLEKRNIPFLLLSNEEFNHFIIQRAEGSIEKNIVQEQNETFFAKLIKEETVGAIINEGALGIEPITYLIGNSAVDLVKFILQIIQNL